MGPPRRRHAPPARIRSRLPTSRSSRPHAAATDGVAAYPSGVVGTPGPLDGYCGTGTRRRSPRTTPCPAAGGHHAAPRARPTSPTSCATPSGDLAGYFDYRPKDADEALVAATSTDGGKDWTYDGEALEQNPGYCPTADTNDDGQGHANVITVGGRSYLYTLAPRGRRHAGSRHCWSTSSTPPRRIPWAPVRAPCPPPRKSASTPTPS